MEHITSAHIQLERSSMKPGDLVSAEDRTAWQTLWAGTGILIRPDAGRTYVAWSNSWEILCSDGVYRVIDGSDIEVIEKVS